MKLVIILTLISTCLFAQNFPLLNTTWVFVKGGHKNTVKSMLDFDPEKVIVINFKEGDLANIRYANLSGMYFRSTSEALREIENQLRNNEIKLNEAPISKYKATYQPFPDDEYSCQSGFQRIRNLQIYNKYHINGYESYNINEAAFSTWSQQEPVCYATRRYMNWIDSKKIDCVEGWCADPTSGEASKSDPKYHDVCNKEKGICKIDVTEFDRRESSSFFWNLHIYPKQVWHAKNPITGRVIEEVDYTYEQMINLRNRAIKSNDENDKKFLNPVLSKEKSVIFSAQFVLPSNVIGSQVKKLDFNLVAQNEDQTSFYSYPPKAFSVTSMQDKAGIKKAILKAFAEDGQEQWVENLGYNCPGWETNDLIIGQQAYSIKTDLKVGYYQNASLNNADPSWYKYNEKSINTPNGTSNIVERQLITETESPQTAIVRNADFPYQDYWWKGCPDLPIVPKIPYTRMQLKEVLYHNISKCDPGRFKGYQHLLWVMSDTIFKSHKDPKEFDLVAKRWEQIDKYIENLGTDQAPASRQCPTSPLDVVYNGFFGIRN